MPLLVTRLTAIVTCAFIHTILCCHLLASTATARYGGQLIELHLLALPLLRQPRQLRLLSSPLRLSLSFCAPQRFLFRLTDESTGWVIAVFGNFASIFFVAIF